MDERLPEENKKTCLDDNGNDMPFDVEEQNSNSAIMESTKEMPTEEEMEEFLAFLKKTDNPEHVRRHEIAVPEALAGQHGFTGSIYGFIRSDSGYHCILGWDGAEPIPELKADCIGAIGLPAPEADQPWISGAYSDTGELVFSIREDGVDVPLKTNLYAMKQDLFSRNAGLMESDWMADKCVVISGCGSVGGTMSLQLARSGVGRFVLIDSDCVEIHNVCRHCCNLTDIGRYKVDAVAERILQINPNAQIRKFHKQIQDVIHEDYADWISPRNALFIGTCDNRTGNAYANDIANRFGAPFLSIGFMTRAWGGELFLCLPERHDVCYRCAFRKQVDAAVFAEHLHNYVDRGDAETVKIEPGLDVDLEYGISFADKVVLDILNRHNHKYKFRILHTLTQFTVFSGTADRTDVSDGWSKLFTKALDYSRIGIRPALRRKDCSFCGQFIETTVE